MVEVSPIPTEEEELEAAREASRRYRCCCYGNGVMLLFVACYYDPIAQLR